MPQRAWSNKRERQYEHIKQGEKKSGTSTKRAKEIAARTVNKERARSGEARSSSRTSRQDMSSSRRGGQRSGTNRPKGRTKEQLYNEAKRMNITGRSKMSKLELQRAVDRRTEPRSAKRSRATILPGSVAPQDPRPRRLLAGRPRPDRGLRHLPPRDARDRAHRRVHPRRP